MSSKVIYPVIAALGIAAVGGGAWWYQNQPAKALGDASNASATAPQGAASASAGGGSGGGKPTVEVAKVERMNLVDESQTVGSLRSRQSVVLRPEVSGRITQLNFRDGDRVKKGQLLVQFDDQLPMAQIQQAQAELSIAMANNKRNEELVAQNFISRRTLDESAASLQVAEAKLALARATAARLKIVAPFDGLAGIRTVNVGDYLKDGADVVNIEDIDAIFVDYRLPERFQTKIRRGQSSVIELDALPGRKFSATVLAIDPLIDANGRSVGVRACIDNRRLQLRPGMFARVGAVFGRRDNARVIPEEAIVPQGGRQFVVKLVNGPEPDSRVTQRVEVKVGLRSPGKVEILEGLEAGETVVTAGQQRVQRDGTAVRVIDLAAGSAPRAGASAPAAGASAPAAGASVAAGPGPAATAAAPVAKAAPRADAKSAPKGGANALPPLLGPDPCLAGMDDIAPRGGQPAASPGRKPVADASPEALPARAPA
jgi:membrane fusion protein (multidrug efflux system)